tara:strand:- start:16 stop:333 length:318 start_codon:yes stop_codon:yes gene_type:complete
MQGPKYKGKYIGHVVTFSGYLLEDEVFFKFQKNNKDIRFIKKLQRRIPVRFMWTGKEWRRDYTFQALEDDIRERNPKIYKSKKAKRKSFKIKPSRKNLIGSQRVK